MLKRKLLTDLKAHLDRKEISLIVGPRQAGKTTLMSMLRKELQRRGFKTLFLSLDFESDQPFFQSQKNLLQKIRLELGEGPGYVFIDEIQRKENAGLFLKGIFDMNLPYKFIVSGSGSMELKEKIHESLLGRKRLFELDTLSFEEFVNFRTQYRYGDRLPDFFQIEKTAARHLLQEYIMFGGYPRVVLEAELSEKIRIIDEIYRSFLERDISYLLRIEKPEAFSALIRLTASQIGKLVNYSEISSTLGLALKTVQNYLWYAEKTFVLRRVAPFFRNIRKEVTKSPVYYFTDLGLRNYCLGIFGATAPHTEMGFLFQNFIFNLLREKLTFTPAELHFWRTKNKAEVDFVVEMGENLIPIEVKYRQLERPRFGRSLRSFINKYKPRVAYIVNLTLEAQQEVGSTKVLFLPYHHLMLQPPSFLYQHTP